jgi:hypothetical protein
MVCTNGFVVLRVARAPRESFRLPVWIQGVYNCSSDRHGNNDASVCREELHLMLRYNGTSSQQDQGSARFVELRHYINVLPLLEVTHFSKPSFARLNEHALCVEVHCVQDPYRLNRLLGHPESNADTVGT